MKTIQIRHVKTRSLIFSGSFRNIREAAEAAIADNVSLAFAELSHANLAHAELDGGDFDQACLNGANLTAANLSECSFHAAQMANTQLHSAVFCQSHLEAVDFRGALFGATDITDAYIGRCQFDTLSALEMNFRSIHGMGLSGFTDSDSVLCGISRPPLVIKGLDLPLACLDSHAVIGSQAIAFDALRNILTCAKNPPASVSSHLYAFLRAHRNLLDSLMETRKSFQNQAQKAA